MKGALVYGSKLSPAKKLIAGTCRAQLRSALQQWAVEARRREAEEADDASSSSSSSTQVLPGSHGGEALSGEAAPGEGGRPSADATAPGAGQLYSQRWRRGVLAGAASSAYVRRAVGRNVTSLARIAAGVDAVCGGVRAVEAALAAAGGCAASADCGLRGDCGAGGGCEGTGNVHGPGSDSVESRADSSSAVSGSGATWPEACWPVPHMPFNKAAPAPSSKYLVFAYSDEQLSNSRSHLVEAARIAHATNRILVLPKGSRSHLSVALSLPFCAYFDLSHFDSASWVSPDLFLLMARAALSAPSVGFMLLQSAYMRKQPFMHQPVAAMLGELAVYGMGHVPNTGNAIDVTMPATSDAVLARLHAWQHKQVVVWVKDTWERIAFEPQTDLLSFQMLPYSRPWHAMAHAVMAHLPPRFIAVHLRSEFIAFRLVSALRAMPPNYVLILFSSLPCSPPAPPSLPLPSSPPLLLSSSPHLKKDGTRANATMLEEVMTGCVRAARGLIQQAQRDTHTTAVFIAADVPFTASSPFISPTQAQRLKRDGRQANASMLEDMMTGCVRAARMCHHPTPIPIPSILLSSSPSITPTQAQRLKRDGRQANASMLEDMMTGCVRAARDLIEQAQRDTHTTSVFIAADVPFTARPRTPRAGADQARATLRGGKPGGGEAGEGGGEQEGGEQAGGGQGAGEQEVVRSDSWATTTWSFGDGERVRAAPRDSLRWLRESVKGTVMLDEVLPEVNRYDPGECRAVQSGVCASRVLPALLALFSLPFSSSVPLPHLPLSLVSLSRIRPWERSYSTIPCVPPGLQLSLLVFPSPHAGIVAIVDKLVFARTRVPGRLYPLWGGAGPKEAHQPPLVSFPSLSLFLTRLPPSPRAGIVAIVDKLVCAHAHVFLAGSIPCGGGRGFEADINNHRSHLNHPPSSRKRWSTDATTYLNTLV
ncbi:unnamed protein product [Closterium sp. Naga37s-1]|nr:unnamed protein product [Closterium sp. Naga37s-1]